MVMNECSACPRCGGRLKYYDSVPRLVRTKGRQTSRVPMRRLRCSGCGAIHRATVFVGPTLKSFPFLFSRRFNRGLYGGEGYEHQENS